MSEVTTSLLGHYSDIQWRLWQRTIEEINVSSETFPKVVSDDADVTFSGRVFYSLEAATGKARSLMVDDGWVAVAYSRTFGRLYEMVIFAALSS